MIEEPMQPVALDDKEEEEEKEKEKGMITGAEVEVGVDLETTKKRKTRERDQEGEEEEKEKNFKIKNNSNTNDIAATTTRKSDDDSSLPSSHAVPALELPPFAQHSGNAVAPMVQPPLLLDQVQQLLAQQHLIQLQNIQQQFALQQQELVRNPPKDFVQAFQLLQHLQAQATYNFTASASANAAAVMMNPATSSAVVPSLLNPLSLAMNGGNINNDVTPLINKLKEYQKELEMKEKLLNEHTLYKHANKKLDNISIKSIMSQHLEGTVDRETGEEKKGDAEEAGIAPKARATRVETTKKRMPSLKEKGGTLTSKIAIREEGSRFVYGRTCGVQGCEVLCEKSRSLVGVVQQCCEMHKREDRFMLKGREGIFRWCFYCHRPQYIEEFSPSSKSICTEKFALRKERRKLASQKQKLLAEASKSQTAMHQQQVLETMQSNQSKASTKEKEKLPRTSEEIEAMQALCDIVADEERRENEEKESEEKKELSQKQPSEKDNREI